MSTNGKNDFNTNTDDTAKSMANTAKNVGNIAEDIGGTAARAAGNKIKKALKPALKAMAAAAKKALMAFFATFGKYIVIAIAVIIGIALIIGMIWYITKMSLGSEIRDSVIDVIDSIIGEDDNDEEDDDNGEETVNFSRVATIEGSDKDGYYIKVSSAVLDNIIQKLKENGVKPESLGLNSFDCFKTFIEAEIITQFPNLGNTNLENNSNDIIVNGCIDIQRAQVQDNGENKLVTLSYTNLENFNKMVEENNSSSLNYFSLNENGELLIASYSSTKVTVTTEGDTSIVEGIPQGEDTYTITTSNINYKNVINKYTMPFMFFIGILEGSNSEEMAVGLAKLAKSTKITITVEDNTQINDSTEITKCSKKYEGYKEFKYTIKKVYNYKNNAVVTTLVDNQAATVLASPDEKTCTITTKTHTERNTPNIEITYVDSWIAKAEKEYTASIENNSNSSSVEPTETKENANIADFNIDTDPDVATFMKQKVAYYTAELNKEKVPTDSNYVSRYIWSSKNSLAVPNLKIVNTYESSTTSSSQNKKYTSTVKETVSNEEKIFEIFDANKNAFGVMDDAEELLYKLLESSSNTVNYSDIMKYLINKYKDPNYNGELDLSIFDIDDFEIPVSIRRAALVKEYIRYWEHSSPPPTNADGTKYIIETDGAGHPTVGYGVDIENSGYKQLFIDAGYPTTVGGEVPIEFVDAIEDEKINEAIENVKSKTAGLNLTSYQITALVSRSYNCGLKGALEMERGSSSLNFVQSYEKYYNFDTDDQFEEKNSNANFSHSLYTQYMSKPVTSDGVYMLGLEIRRKSEWTLFQTGYYDVLERWHVEANFDCETIEAAGYVFPHYYQRDWPGSYGTSTIPRSGCGPTSLSMILAGLLVDDSITPQTVVDNIKDYWPDGSYYVTGVGSSHCIFNSSFLEKYYGVRSQSCSNESDAIKALEQGYPVIGGEQGHILAIIPAPDEYKAQGYKFYILDSARGHDGAYRSVQEANQVVKGTLSFIAIIKP